MHVCASCGRESDGDFRFCPHCGAPFEKAEPAREQRKRVTVLFCDVTGSTALGESTDPEALRALLARYFDRMKGIVEAHGGTVEKFIGDAVMAVFGVPVLHEDDAVRACRAAIEMREAFPELGINGRIGINSGEVVTGTSERLATGDAVNVAARLEQAAAPGEVLIGAVTLSLARDAIDVEAVAPLTLKGKSEPIPAFRLLSARTTELARVFGTPMVGRETELRRLRDAFTQAAQDRTCQLFTVLGTAGVGKTRLVAEFLSTVDAQVVRGRCLSYGEGITYWPVVEIVRQLGALPETDAAQPIRALLGETEFATSSDEIAWGFRKLIEQHAQERPIVCVFDDLHWAEETLLDLVEHLAEFSRDAAVLVLCMARPELLEKRPAWGGGKWNATTLLLEPLNIEETAVMLDALGGVEIALRQRIAATAEGNPLYLEEMLALVRESGGGEISVPPTIQALLAARLDQLDPAERQVLERGAVEGHVFHASAVQALANGEPQLPRLRSLVRKQLVRPDKPQFVGEDAYRFRHLLIRDAAYDALPKAERADLHVRFASWLGERGVDLVELDEILGHHLEQAVRYKADLGQSDAPLADRAAERLAAAGRRALGRGDDRAAASLLERALALTRPLRLDVHLELDLALAHATDPRTAAGIAKRAAERARTAGDAASELLGLVVSARHRLEFEDSVEELEALAREAVPLLEEAKDDAGLYHVWSALAELANHRGMWDEITENRERALHHARRTGQPMQSAAPQAAVHFVMGSEPADALLRKLEELQPTFSHPGLMLNKARLLAMLDRPSEAWPLALQGSDRLRELTGDEGGEHYVAQIASDIGDDEAAASFLRVHCDRLEAQHRFNNLSTYAPMLGRSLCALGRYDEAEVLAEQGRALGHEEDLATQALWRQVQALVLSHRGQYAQAEVLAREAVAVIDRGTGLNFQGAALCDLADVLIAGGATDEAAAALDQALERYERKRNLAMARRVRERLGKLQPA